MKWCSQGFVLLILAASGQLLSAAEKVELAEPESDTRVRLVRSHVQVSGLLQTAAGGGEIFRDHIE